MTPTDATTPATQALDEYLIRKNGYWYRPNAQGYTLCEADAGRFTLNEAISYSHPNGPDGPRDGITYEPAPVQSLPRRGDVGTAEALDDLANKPVGGDFALRAFNVVRCLAKAEFRSELDRCKDEAEYLMASLKDSELPDYLRLVFPEMSAALTPSALSGDAGEGE